MNANLHFVDCVRSIDAAKAAIVKQLDAAAAALDAAIPGPHMINVQLSLNVSQCLVDNKVPTEVKA